MSIKPLEHIGIDVPPLRGPTLDPKNDMIFEYGDRSAVLAEKVGDSLDDASFYFVMEYLWTIDPQLPGMKFERLLMIIAELRHRGMSIVMGCKICGRWKQVNEALTTCSNCEAVISRTALYCGRCKEPQNTMPFEETGQGKLYKERQDEVQR